MCTRIWLPQDSTFKVLEGSGRAQLLRVHALLPICRPLRRWRCRRLVRPAVEWSDRQQRAGRLGCARIPRQSCESWLHVGIHPWRLHEPLRGPPRRAARPARARVVLNSTTNRPQAKSSLVYAFIADSQSRPRPRKRRNRRTVMAARPARTVISLNYAPVGVARVGPSILPPSLICYIIFVHPGAGYSFTHTCLEETRERRDRQYLSRRVCTEGGP